jgi:choline dehydrogenase-like flavoprotein
VTDVNDQTHKAMQPESFIVVGSGSAGGVVASRLSENGKYKVLCLEAGTKASYVFTRPPLGLQFLVDNPKVDWCYESEPDPSHGNRRLPVPRGKMLGGSSSINAIVYNRGQKLDYDTWSELGCKGWSYREVLPYLKKIESTEIGSDEYRGRSGPIKVTQTKKLSSFFDLFIASAGAAGALPSMSAKSRHPPSVPRNGTGPGKHSAADIFVPGCTTLSAARVDPPRAGLRLVGRTAWRRGKERRQTQFHCARRASAQPGDRKHV